MKSAVRRSTAMFMALVMFASLFLGVNLPVQAAEVDYVTSGNYILNWGERGEDATYLSQNAEAFYTENGTSYEELAALAGGNTVNTVPGSALYEELQDLMVENHTHETAYDETKDLYQYTDCQNSGQTSTAISSFYSGAAIGPEWGSTPTWNREHTWPNSKGLGGNDENDIMMLRPTATSENSSRGNTAYGESSGYFDPNGASNGAYDLRGDVARIMLYQYVRWGNTSNMWGTTGVMESEEVLLSWMEADPVDTWELGRNDSVESITGTRNVFVDYPELAFILFGKAVPVNYTTPSGNAPDGEVTGTPKTVSFKQLGTVVAAQTVYGGETITLPAHTGAVKEGYTFLGWVAAEVAETTSAPTIYAAGSKYTVIDNATLYALYSRSEEGSESASTLFEAYSGALTEGDYIIVFGDAAMTAEDTGKTRLKATDVEFTGSDISTDNASIIWKVEKDGEYWTLYNESTSKYAAGTGSKNKATVIDSVTDYAKWTVNGTEGYEFINKGNEADNVNSSLRRNSDKSVGFACYSKTADFGGPLSLYKRASASVYYFTSEGSSSEVATGYYEKVTVAPTDWSGKYLIVYEADKRALDGSLTTLDAKGNYVSVEIVDNKIAATDTVEDITFTIAAIEGGYSLKSASGYYIGNASDKNKLLSSQDTTYVNTFAVTGDGTDVVSDVTHLRYNTSDGRFRYYESTSYTDQAAIALYKYVEVEVDTEAPVVTGVENGETYLTTQKVTVIGDDIATVTVNGEVKETTFTLEGNKSVIYTIVATDTNGNSTTVIVNMRPVAVVASGIKDLTVNNVKATDKADIEAVLAEVTVLLADENLSEAEEAELNAIKVNAEALLKKIEDDEKAPEITPPGGEDSDDENSEEEEEVTPPGTDDGPDTGDHNINLLWYTMLFMGGAGLVALRISEHKEKMTFK